MTTMVDGAKIGTLAFQASQGERYSQLSVLNLLPVNPRVYGDSVGFCAPFEKDLAKKLCFMVEMGHGKCQPDGPGSIHGLPPFPAAMAGLWDHLMLLSMPHELFGNIILDLVVLICLSDMDAAEPVHSVVAWLLEEKDVVDCLPSGWAPADSPDNAEHGTHKVEQVLLGGRGFRIRRGCGPVDGSKQCLVVSQVSA